MELEENDLPRLNYYINMYNKKLTSSIILQMACAFRIEMCKNLSYNRIEIIFNRRDL